MPTNTTLPLGSSVLAIGSVIGVVIVMTLFFSERSLSRETAGVPELEPNQIEKVDYAMQHFAIGPKGNALGAHASSLFRITEKGVKPALIHRFSHRINSIHVMAGGEIIVATDQDHWDPDQPSLIYLSTNHGQNFTLIKIINGGSALWWSIDSDDSGRLFVGEYGPRENGHSKSVHMTTDFGQTWSTVFTAPANDRAHIHRVAVDPYTNDVWVTVGDGAKNRGAWRSTDGGATFSKIVDTQATSMAFTETTIFFGEDRRQQPGITSYSRDTGKVSDELNLESEFDSGGSVYSLAFSASGALYASNMKYPTDKHTSSLWRRGPNGWASVVDAPARPGGGAGFESIGGPDRHGYMYVNGFRIFDPKVR